MRTKQKVFLWNVIANEHLDDTWILITQQYEKDGTLSYNAYNKKTQATFYYIDLDDLNNLKDKGVRNEKYYS